LQKYCGKRLKENKKRKMYMYNNPNSTVGLKIKIIFVLITIVGRMPTALISCLTTYNQALNNVD
jgi:hypothetical protein